MQAQNPPTMLRTLTLTMLLTLSAVVNAQSLDQPFKGHFVNRENNVHLHIDLYEESLIAPGYSFLGNVPGYINGNVYGIWLMVSHKIKGDNKATLRFANDIGSDAQNIEIEILNDSTLSYRATGSAVIKKVVNRKLVKIPTQFKMVRVK